MTGRTTTTKLDSLFLNRWSPRAFEDQPIPQDDIDTMLDAARHAPSAYNYQPWTFLYALNGDENWDRFLSLLVPFNQDWAKGAPALFFIVSELTMGDPEKPNHTHSFDAGAAWASFAFQASLLGYHTHGMSGVDFDRAQKELNVPEGFRVEAAFVVGKIGSPDTLPDFLKEREVPSDRKPLDKVGYPGNFRA
ncbi:nitroreductase family protein [Sphingobium sp. CR28]|uniref:nitroreductase family protein n=1 Tax=Sphingobium sp. CR28 TaxID=3400272 RepID=UPI003FEFCC27